MRTSLRPVLATSLGLLPVCVLLAVLNDGPIWVGLVGWVAATAVIVPLGLALNRLRSRSGSR
ncbi:hypothetical protein [Micromonospora sp. WMMC250]|uniref:hypothetical protein n=1 Tax=Micromonospora sp. WMMC250 TaxID=3014781 RepID=UPI0022B66D6B|nr:hypothetical protein [Micromonospora sp. WMMC250]MCZ7378882.1 hypothetical protein [Micromonospora sp. WMMC250]